VRPHQYLQAKAHICNATGHRTLHMHQLQSQQSVFARPITCIGYATGRWTDRCDAAGVGRIAQRAADVVAQADRAQLRVRPNNELMVCGRSAMSGRLVRPIGIAPAARIRSTTGASVGTTAWANAGTPGGG
jgi:hypothetical protein